MAVITARITPIHIALAHCKRRNMEKEVRHRPGQEAKSIGSDLGSQTGMATACGQTARFARKVGYQPESRQLCQLS